METKVVLLCLQNNNNITKGQQMHIITVSAVKNRQLERLPEDGISKQRSTSEQQLICELINIVYCMSVC
jgi:hypothetical protein